MTRDILVLTSFNAFMNFHSSDLNHKNSTQMVMRVAVLSIVILKRKT